MAPRVGLQGVEQVAIEKIRGSWTLRILFGEIEEHKERGVWLIYPRIVPVEWHLVWQVTFLEHVNE